MIRKSLFAGTALSLGLALGVASAALAAEKTPKAPTAAKIVFSKEFIKAAAELDKTISGGVKNPAVIAASQRARAAGKDAAAKAAATAEIDAALGGNVSARIDAAAAAATTPSDRLKVGEMTRTYGVLTDAPALQYKGTVMMLDSGMLPAANVGSANWVAGVAAYQLGDYAGAAKYVQIAKDSGFQDPQIEGVLTDAYRRSNNMGGALQNAQRDIAASKTAGRAPSETSIRTALQAAYDGKQTAAASDLSVLLVQYYPTPAGWTSAIGVVRSLAGYGYGETLDLSRLMLLTGSLATQRDYVDYIQAADPRRSPGEVMKVINLGIAQGKLKSGDMFVTEARTMAQGRVAADRASLPKFERDARAAAATKLDAMVAADAYMSYDDYAKAADLYKLALTKPGVDVPRAQTRLGIAQIMLGQTAEAQASFAKVTGSRQPIAGLWSAYAAQKAKPVGVVPAS